MKRGRLPLNALRAFEATMRHGQMRLAADELGVTHSAVSRQVRLLEKMLGLALFEGPRNRLVPTAAAQALQPALAAAFDGLEEAVRRVMQNERRALDLSCLSTLAMRWLIPRLVGFQARHPGIEVRLTADDGPVDFARQRLDVAIRVGAGPWGAAEVTRLFPDRAGPVLSPALLPPGGLADPADLLALPILHTRTRPGAWAAWCRDAGCGGADLAPPAGGRSFEHFYFMLEAATAGIGVAIAPEVLVRDDLAAGRLIAPFGFLLTGQDYVALRPARAPADAATAAFVDWLAQEAAAPGTSAPDTLAPDTLAPDSLASGGAFP
ncbi:LysR substrate-binding domain-containing protein [Phaeovulum vinaykumarii]|uniref:DNA-binding transcriptional regulator, LysR family n=1 Tax=Phaeovulum vinaykumarii TaxID=407234 RepID=A0A1N7L2S8_9RHOB|nr:LysR substrate-binding domain-containing protein [Phaeovulum vinaykumarii]SIS68056.1 DNA-binding transcriptional regulator, LysR family [Phaeovulum vinaykumarii]SOC00373.1 DNA-binding transcriptional LysR family regulator [Phaeovulum vinaykumarii]